MRASLIIPGVVAALSAQLAQTPPPAQGGGAGGRGGGPGAVAAALFVEKCAGCHGTDLSGGRAASLFDQKVLARLDDDRLARIIRAGLPAAGMPAFNDLAEEQVGQLIHHIRAETGNLAPKPAFVANPAGHILKTEKQTVKAELIADGLDTPWALAFLPDGRLLVTERTGNLRIIDKGQLSEPVKGTPTVHVQQDGGMMDIELHPNYARNGWIYLAYSEVRPGFTPPPPSAAPPTPAVQPGRGRGPQIPSMTVIVRGKLNRNNEWTDQQLIFRAPPDIYTTNGTHFGLRFLFDREGHLFYSIGERGVPQNAQDLSNPLGKIHRINEDGSVPNDNPFVNTPGALPTIWSYGHRNPQGLAWDPVTGRMWSSEHGPSGGDEINIIERGKNYGWGVVSKGLANGITKRSQPGMEEPLTYYTPSIGPSQVAFYTGNRFPGWKNTSLFVAGMAGHQLRRLQIADNTITAEEVIVGQFGRVRDVVQGPDGYFYLALQNPTGSGTGLPLSASTPGRVIRLVPAASQTTARAAKSLDIYYIDVEGGQATLFVSPSGESLLVDTGNAGGRDLERLVAALDTAGVKQIDHMWTTHYHGDHVGAMEELAKRVPIRHFYDHGPLAPNDRATPATFLPMYETLSKGRRTIVKPGDKLPMAGLDITTVSSNAVAIKSNLPGAGKPNPACVGVEKKDESAYFDPDNGSSAGFAMTFGRFRTVDLGDLTWNGELDLVCPVNRIGKIDLYLVSHHGIDRSNSPALVHGLEPRVAIMNNGTRKGGAANTFKVLESSPGLEDLWQLHWSHNVGVEHNAPGTFIANIDDNETIAGVLTAPPPAPRGSAGAPGARGAGGSGRPGGPGGAAGHTPAYWLKVSAERDGTFTITNTRNGFSKTYRPGN